MGRLIAVGQVVVSGLLAAGVSYAMASKSVARSGSSPTEDKTSSESPSAENNDDSSQRRDRRERLSSRPRWMPGDKEHGEELQEMDERIEALEREAEPSAELDAAPRSADEAWGRVEEQIETREARFRSDPRDPDWAPDAERKFFDTFDELRETVEFELLSTECKTDTCKASVKFESFEVGRNIGHELAQLAIPDLNCVQELYFSRPDDPMEPAEASVYLDCTDLRVEQLGNQ